MTMTELIEKAKAEGADAINPRDVTMALHREGVTVEEIIQVLNEALDTTLDSSYMQICAGMIAYEPMAAVGRAILDPNLMRMLSICGMVMCNMLRIRMEQNNASSVGVQ